MKKNLIIILILLCFNDLYSQEYEYVDSLESVQINIKAEEVSKNGIELGVMNTILLQKIEELTLHLIQLKKENEEIKKMINKE
jgi:hypothetical protein